MPFVAAIPGILGAFGVGIPSGVAAGLAAATGALGLAQGIAQKDPFGALAGAASGITGGLSSLGTIPTSVAQAAQSGTGLLAAQDPLQAATAAGGLLSSTVPDLTKYVGGPVKETGAPQLIPEISNDMGQAFLAPATQTKNSSLLGTIGNVLGGVAGAGTGIMGLINSFKDNTASSPHLGFGSLDTNVPMAPGARAGNLPTIKLNEVAGPGRVPEFDLTDPKANNTLLQLLGAYRV